MPIKVFSLFSLKLIALIVSISVSFHLFDFLFTKDLLFITPFISRWRSLCSSSTLLSIIRLLIIVLFITVIVFAWILCIRIICIFFSVFRCFFTYIRIIFLFFDINFSFNLWIRFFSSFTLSFIVRIIKSRKQRFINLRLSGWNIAFWLNLISLLIWRIMIVINVISFNCARI